ncbi:glutamate racemase [Olivibacter sp. XZL3]|uniref:glutamate racemase n=1 Tax=Olivibacter sp. XZL3 TaxID=1735116 RepID=UPI00106603F0|nr:glutamate racemase [Olivibacter sp. XZL3]
MGPIGIFDSGYGGLTVFKEISNLLPQYDYIYLGDNARVPYGTRSYDTVYQYTLECVNHLFDMGCHLVILACNTASAKALRSIQQKDLPQRRDRRNVLGVIRPTTELIDRFTTSKHVGILATSGTVNSQSYVLEILKFFPAISVYQEACPMWVPLVENNEMASAGARYFVKQHIDRLFQQSNAIDAVILACTHYPLLLPLIKEFIPKHVQVISQGNIVAHSLADYLTRHREMESLCTKGGNKQFFTTESIENFNEKAGLFYGSKVEAQHLDLMNKGVSCRKI